MDRISFNDSEIEISTDCISIRHRNYFPVLPNTKDEADYPIAYLRIVFTDYLFLEMELSVEYAPQNFYCYVIDQKSNSTFKNRVRNLSRCFPNVYVSMNEYDTDSSGKQMNYAYMDCLRILVKHQWNYVVI